MISDVHGERSAAMKPLAIQAMGSGRNGPTAPWWLLLLLLLALNVPNLMPWERALYPATWLIDLIDRLVKCIVLALVVLALFRKPWKAWLAAWVLVLWWMPISLAVRWVTEGPITSSLVGMAMATSAGELVSLVLSFSWLWMVLLLGWNLCMGLWVRWLRRQSAWEWRSRWRLSLGLICLALVLAGMYQKWGRQERMQAQTSVSAAHDPFGDGDRPVGADGDLPYAFPFELPWALAQYWQAKQVVDSARTNLKKLPAESGLAVDAASPDLVVLVVGESSSRSAWQLFNPAAPATTPLLLRRLASQGLYLFEDVVAQSTSTRQAVPSMLSPQPLMWPDGRPNANATQSIVSLASQAGYRTAWLSNQAAVGKFDGVIAAYAEEAQSRAFLNPASFMQQGTHDEVLLAPLKRHLAAHPKVFVVLHTMGSHFRFDHRYPPAFERFDSSKGDHQAYWNTVAYTDHVLDQVIEMLERDGRKAALLYVSDHGQGLPEKKCKKAEVNRVTKEAYEVPAFVWLSSSLRAARPEFGERLKAQRGTPYTTAAVYQTLRDLVEAPAPHVPVPIDQGQSFFSAPAIPVPQRVVAPSLHWVDFRPAAERNPCFIGAP